MERLLYTDPNAVASLYDAIRTGNLRTIVTDVTMAASGIRKGALQRLGVEVKCYLNDERVAEMATSKGITRTQAGIRLAVEEHPDALFVFGNAPTALMELCDLIRKEKAQPAGIVAAPVGFVHVEESKHMTKPFTRIPKLIVEGRKGGSNLAATLVNAILCYPDAESTQTRKRRIADDQYTNVLFIRIVHYNKRMKTSETTRPTLSSLPVGKRAEEGTPHNLFTVIGLDEQSFALPFTFRQGIDRPRMCLFRRSAPSRHCCPTAPCRSKVDRHHRSSRPGIRPLCRTSPYHCLCFG